MPAIKLGMNGKLYYGDAGSTAATELKNARDLTLNVEKDSEDTSTREGGGFKTYAGALIDVSIEFEMNDDGGAAYLALRTSFISRTPLAFLCLNAADGQGIDGDFEVFKFPSNQPLSGGVKTSVVLKPVFVTRPPAWVTPASS